MIDTGAMPALSLVRRVALHHRRSNLTLNDFAGALRSILAEKIHDGRFLRLIDGLLQAGYLEDWRYHETLSGAPQGGVLSPRCSPTST